MLDDAQEVEATATSPSIFSQKTSLPLEQRKRNSFMLNSFESYKVLHGVEMWIHGQGALS